LKGKHVRGKTLAKIVKQLAGRASRTNKESVGHSVIMAPPVAAAIASETPRAMSRRTGSTGSFTGCPPMRMV
jgi:hypothetical protein